MKILVVDDNEDSRAMIASFVKKVLFAEVAIDTCGNDAIFRLQAGEKFDAIISDWRMPNGTGIELFEFVRSSHIHSLFVFFTSAPDEVRVNCKDKWFLGAINKTDIKELGLRIAMAACTISDETWPT